MTAIGQEDSAKASVTVAASNFYPSLNLTGTVGKFGPEFYPDQDRWSLGVTLSLPIFTGGRDYYGYKSAVSSRAAATYNIPKVRKDTLDKLKQAFVAFVEAVEKLKVDTSFKYAAQVRAEIARKKYNNGLLTFEDWDIIENDLITREKTYLQSRRDRGLSEASWEQAQGKGVIR
jgi:outer membrane protein TolC